METTKKYFITLTTIVSFLFFLCNSSYTQEKNSSASKNSLTENTESSPDETGGFWMLSNSGNNIFNSEKDMQWTNSSEGLTAERSWFDQLNIEHTVNCGFRVDIPPEKMIPGQEVILNGSYTDLEYSTTKNLPMGFKVYIEREDVINNKLHREGIEILKVAKNSKQHNTEERSGVIMTPRHYFGESKIMKICIDCYVGPDHYITTYVYNWIES